MNDLARDTLVAAALNGVKQIKGVYSGDDGGRCAMGVLMEEASVNWTDISMQERFGLNDSEEARIIYANDTLGWSFLTIARKGVDGPEFEAIGAASFSREDYWEGDD